MACTIEDITDQFDPRDFDKALGDLLLGHEGNTLQYLVTVLDFLKRKSNFFKQGDPKKRLLEAYKQVAGEGDGFRSGFFGGPSKTSTSSAAAQVGQSTQHLLRAQWYQQGVCCLQTALTHSCALMQAVKPDTAVAGASSSTAAAAAAAATSRPAATSSVPQAAAAAGGAAGPSHEAVPAQPPSPDVDEEPEASDQNKGLGEWQQLGTQRGSAEVPSGCSIPSCHGWRTLSLCTAGCSWGTWDRLQPQATRKKCSSM
jgi:hypothetical protein